MIELTDRQKVILSLVIREYTQTAVPVGSKNLVEHYRLEYSPATVRNELAALTEMGYLRQPHTSAGRVPTEDGYRYFVGRLLQRTELPAETRRTIIHQFYQTHRDMDQWMRLAASVLAHQSQGASLVTAPHLMESRFKHLELISTRGRQVLVVLVTVGGQIHQRIMTLNEPVSQEELSAIGNRLTGLLNGKDTRAVSLLRSQLLDLDFEVAGWVEDQMRTADALVSGEIYLDGITNVLAEPEFAESEEARRALRVLEERSVLQDLLSRTVLSEHASGVQVLIGGEGNWEELSQCSIVLAQYGAPGVAVGTLGVLGPMRMSYGRTISTVRFISALLSDFVAETMGE
ncbi:MAG: heat-inducible transcription repressor HrcA [Chloroflexi bacterium]|nr:heat-inducible transcription repressor HrcA [Chloroflexota bacterium]